MGPLSMISRVYYCWDDGWSLLLADTGNCRLRHLALVTREHVREQAMSRALPLAGWPPGLLGVVLDYLFMS